MSISELGEFFDIHTGGVDLLFPHHENEIAQSEAATGKKFVNYWMEGEHLMVDGGKMAKRDKNIFTLADIVKRGFDPLALRYLFLTAHYRSKLNFTWESLSSAQNALDNIKFQISNFKSTNQTSGEEGKNLNSFKNAINNDLDMPRAVAVFHEALKNESRDELLKMDEVLGLGLGEVKKAELPAGAKALIEKREKLRAEGKFEESDKIRADLLGMGVEIEDTENGSIWKIIK